MVLGSPGQPHYSSKTLSYNGVHLTILNLEPLPHSLNFLASFIHSCGPTIALPVLDYPRERWEIPEDKRGPWVHGKGTMCWYNNTCIHTPPPTSLHSHSGCLHSHRPPLTWSKSVTMYLFQKFTYFPSWMGFSSCWHYIAALQVPPPHNRILIPPPISFLCPVFDLWVSGNTVFLNNVHL